MVESLEYNKNSGFNLYDKTPLTCKTLEEYSNNITVSNKDFLNWKQSIRNKENKKNPYIKISKNSYSTKRYIDYSSFNKYITLYTDIKFFFSNNLNINKESQKELERFLNNRGIEFDNDKQQSIFKQNIFKKKYFREFLITISPKLNDHIDRLLKFSDEYKKLSVDKSIVHLIDIIEVIGKKNGLFNIF